MDLIIREPMVAAPRHLVPSGEKATHSLTGNVTLFSEPRL